MSANKLPEHYENPIDTQLYRIINYLNPILYNVGFTPNIITTISFGLGLWSIYAFMTKSYILSGILLFLSYFFDCADGNFARRYDMVTTFGDWYDHITDLVVVIGLMVVILRNNKITATYKFGTLSIIFILLLCVLMHLAYQEEYYRKSRNDKNETSMMDTYINKLFNMDLQKVENLEYTRYLGCGTWFSLFSLVIMGVKYNV